MTITLVAFLSALAAFAAGALVYRHNAKKAAKLEAKAKAVVEALRVLTPPCARPSPPDQ